MTGSTLQPNRHDRRNLDPYRRLACALLAQALQQAAGQVSDSTLSNFAGKNKRAQTPAIVAQARHFLQSKDARFWCEMAGDDFDFEALQGLIGDPGCIPDGPLGRQADPPSQAKNHPEWARPLAVPGWYQEKLR